MSDNRSFDEIMQEITAGLTGNPKEDFSYLKSKCQEYKDHDMAKEIMRACGRLMYDLLPEDKKKAIANAADNDSLGIESVLEEIRFNYFKKNYDKALQMMEDLVAKVEGMHMYEDDQVSEYREFNELFEEVLYVQKNNPTKTIRRPQHMPYTEIYELYGSLLVELHRPEDARRALEKGLCWNPMHFGITTEYLETYKMEGDMDHYLEGTLNAFKIAIHAPQLARCLRNLGYYFVEKKLYPEAVAVYTLSCEYEKSQTVSSELYYISQVAGNIETPSIKDLEGYADKYDFPIGADKDVIGWSYAYGMHCAEKGQHEEARYFLEILYELTNDEEVRKIIDAIPASDGNA